MKARAPAVRNRSHTTFPVRGSQPNTLQRFREPVHADRGSECSLETSDSLRALRAGRSKRVS
jgi:hypothetical protein